MSATARQKSGNGMVRYGQRVTDCFSRPFFTTRSAAGRADARESAAANGRPMNDRRLMIGTAYDKWRVLGKGSAHAAACDGVRDARDGGRRCRRGEGAAGWRPG